jgi:hypothetical protein
MAFNIPSSMRMVATRAALVLDVLYRAPAPWSGPTSVGPSLYEGTDLESRAYGGAGLGEGWTIPSLPVELKFDRSAPIRRSTAVSAAAARRLQSSDVVE